MAQLSKDDELLLSSLGIDASAQPDGDPSGNVGKFLNLIAKAEGAILAAAHRHKGRVGVIIGYDEPLSHLMQAGGDVILVPSRFEPCGLTQLYGLRFGTIPVVSLTGGLADTIINASAAGLALRAPTRRSTARTRATSSRVLNGLVT